MHREGHLRGVRGILQLLSPAKFPVTKDITPEDSALDPRRTMDAIRAWWQKLVEDIFEDSHVFICNKYGFYLALSQVLFLDQNNAMSCTHQKEP